MSVQFREFRDKAKRGRVAVDGRIDHIQRFVVEHVHWLSVTYVKTMARLVYGKLPPQEQKRLQRNGWTLPGAPHQQAEEIIEVPERHLENGRDALLHAADSLRDMGKYKEAASIYAILEDEAASKLQRKKTG